MLSRRFSIVMLSVVLCILGLTVAGCASVKPMSDEGVNNYTLNAIPENFKNFQYYISRDIVLTYVTSSAESTTVGKVNIKRNVIQLLSSTKGVVYDVKPGPNGYRLGVKFDPDDDSLIWFSQSNNPNEKGTYFYLEYTNEATNTIDYGGNPYKVSYKKATGLGASAKRLITSDKASKSMYKKMEPILLYEERVKSTEKKRNLKGVKISQSPLFYGAGFYMS
jgi:hypothetical protein